jgi:outer membrane protein OmpA-like peptidoglycan-associated protein
VISSRIAWLTLAVAFSARSAAAQQIPLVEGLTVVKAVRDDRGDYEALLRVHLLGADAVQFSVTSDVPNPKDPGHTQQLHINRVVRRADLASAHRMNAILYSSDPPIFPGATAIQISTGMLAELKSKGSSDFVFGMELPQGDAAASLGGLLSARRYFRGTLKRVGGPTTFPVLVNGVRRQLPAIRAKGRVSVGGEGGDVEFVFLDDPQNPLNLQWTFLGWTVQIVSVEWAAPGATAIPAAAASQLRTQCHTEVHGIYFDFASPVIRPESEQALAGVAALLRANPNWAVTIEGHTDSVGGAKANLELSRLRAEAVRSALQTRHGIPASRLSTAGFGSARPVESNKTLEGRARNRRVELSRKC